MVQASSAQERDGSEEEVLIFLARARFLNPAPSAPPRAAGLDPNLYLAVVSWFFQL